MGYKLYDQKWGDSEAGSPSGEITWSMDLSGGLKFDPAYSLSDFEDSMRNAFDRWEEAAQIDFTYVSTGATNVTVETDVLAGSTVGLASWGIATRPGLDLITSGNVTMDLEPTWAPTGTGGLDFFAVALHEIGHILGMDHVVGQPIEIMNDVVSAKDLGPGDLEGIRVLYGESSGTDDPPEGEDPDVPDAPPPEDGGGGGVGAILGLIAAMIALVFGGFGGGAVALAAARTDDNDDPDAPDTDDGDAVLLSDLLPEAEFHEQHVYMSDTGSILFPDHSEEEPAFV